MRTPKYQGIDAIQQWHNDKSKASMSEAFRDATYASPITRFTSDAYNAFSFLVTALIFALPLAFVGWFLITK